ncbi:MAG: hypothetical protein IKR81_07680, partial [Victivallales bacterium]|nr:hypothetical protein [Victivallales bacterium]
LLLFGQTCDAVDIGVGKEWIAVPLRVVEAQRDIIAQFDISGMGRRIGLTSPNMPNQAKTP